MKKDNINSESERIKTNWFNSSNKPYTKEADEAVKRVYRLLGWNRSNGKMTDNKKELNDAIEHMYETLGWDKRGRIRKRRC